MIDLTKDEASAIAELIDMNLIDIIRADTDLDNMMWLRNMVHAYEKLCAYSGYVGLSEPIPDTIIIDEQQDSNSWQINGMEVRVGAKGIE